ncbi:MAG: chitosanase [Acidobacteria bacterium]|nr:chitosanase [Acidobacteriota bacterium]
MNLTPIQKRLIERVVNAFETGSADGNYGAIAIFSDGPHNIRQITYGRSQTTEYGNLRELVRNYVDAGGLFSEALRPFADLVGSTPLTDNAEFKNLLRRAGREDPVMRAAQDTFFDLRYFSPAMNWTDAHQLTEPLSGLVVYDSFIHSGSVLWIIRQTFPEALPDLGGDEMAWTTAYVNARHQWLGNHAREIVRRTTYRTACLQREIARGNWDLAQTPIDANGVMVQP